MEQIPLQNTDLTQILFLFECAAFITSSRFSVVWPREMLLPQCPIQSLHLSFLHHNCTNCPSLFSKLTSSRKLCFSFFPLIIKMGAPRQELWALNTCDMLLKYVGFGDGGPGLNPASHNPLAMYPEHTLHLPRPHFWNKHVNISYIKWTFVPWSNRHSINGYCCWCY